MAVGGYKLLENEPGNAVQTTLASDPKSATPRPCAAAPTPRPKA
ncbi:MAG: hypothetical protein WKG07_07355 [Hymenobacter sp.]